MEMPMNSFESRIINPVWNSSKYNNFQHINMWPLRQQSQNKKYFCSKKLRPNMSYYQPLIRTEIMPYNMKLDIDKQKSYMVFCSTSKLKYMPLPGSKCENLRGFKFGSSNSNILPTFSRSSTRPILLHGQRYTVTASEIKSSNTLVSQSGARDFGNLRNSHLYTAQCKRFNDIENRKVFNHFQEPVNQRNGSQLRKNSYLSGKQMKLRSSKATIEERLTQLQPILNIENRRIHSLKSNNQTSVYYKTIHSPDFHGEQVSKNNSREPTPLINIDESNKSNPPRFLEIQEYIQETFKSSQGVNLDEDMVLKSRQTIIDLFSSSAEKYLEFYTSDLFDLTTTDITVVWEIILPYKNPKTTNSNGSMISFNSEVKNNIFEELDSKSIEVVKFLDLMFPNPNQILERYYWSKIFEDLSIENLNETYFSNLISLKQNLHFVAQNNSREEECLSLMKLTFWISLFKDILYLYNMTIKEWVKKTTIIIFNNNLVKEEIIEIYQSRIQHFIAANLEENQLRMTSLNNLNTISWLLTTLEELSIGPWTLDEMATIRCLIHEMGYQ